MPSLTEVFLHESKCPKCGHQGAYISFMNRVECPNPSCPNYDPKMASKGQAQNPSTGSSKNTRPPDHLRVKARHDIDTGAGVIPKGKKGTVAIDPEYRNDGLSIDFDPVDWEHPMDDDLTYVPYTADEYADDWLEAFWDDWERA